MRKGLLAASGGVNRKLAFADNQLVQILFGQQCQHLRIIDRLLHIKTNVRGNEVILEGAEPAVELAGRTLEELYGLIQAGYPITGQDVQYALRILKENQEADLKSIFLDTVYITALKRRITPKSLNQKRYLQAIRTYDMVFGIGPAGTGKTYLAMAMAVAALVNNDCNRIVLTRPAVEAGEKLGFLPGDLFEKVNPYLRPLYDALHDMMDFDKASQLMQRGVIEVAPLAFMRGRTLNNAFVILDEAQNTTSEQMMMFLTRLGFGSRAVITGDITQVDLPAGASSGLKEAITILQNIDGIDFVYFNKNDVVRHPLVQDIILAYENFQSQKHRPVARETAALRYDDVHDRKEKQP
ncbi:PhoH family protein [Desulfobacca acetoxidans]